MIAKNNNNQEVRLKNVKKISRRKVVKKRKHSAKDCSSLITADRRFTPHNKHCTAAAPATAATARACLNFAAKLPKKSLLSFLGTTFHILDLCSFI